MICRETMEAFKNVDVRNVDPDTLVDVLDVKVDDSLSPLEQTMNHLTQIKNPFCYKRKNMIIKESFGETTATLVDVLVDCFSRMV